MTAATAFRIERLGADLFQAVLLGGHGSPIHRCSMAVCADQAAHLATRGGKRPLRFEGMVGMVAGEMVEIDDRRCDVRQSSWVWAHHGHTHGSLACAERHASGRDVS